MSEDRYLVSDFMKRWKIDFPPNVWEHVHLDGDYVVVPEGILMSMTSPVEAVPVLEPGQQATESYTVAPEQLALTRKQAKPAHLSPARSLRPLSMQLPQQGEPYPYVSVDDLTSRYHRWGHPDEARAWVRALKNSEYVVIDTETTGSMRYSQVIEIAVLDKQGEHLFHSLLKPSTPIEAIATSVHGLSWKDVKDAPTFAEIAQDLYSCLQNKLVLAYNASFDVRLLFQTARAFEVHFPRPEAACLMYCYSKIRGEMTPGGQYRRFRLGDACQAMQIEVPTVQFGNERLVMLKHRAGDDTRYLYELLQRMIESSHFQ